MIRINLLPVRAEKKRESLRQQIVVVVGLLIMVAVGISGIHMMLGNDIDDMEAKIADRRTEISRLQTIIGEVKQFKKKKRELEDKIEVIRQLEDRQRGPAQVLYELAQVIPEEVWLETLRDSKGALALEGVAIDNQTIARFMTRMESSPWFRGVRLEVTRQVTRGNANLKSFSIKASVVYPKAG